MDAFEMLQQASNNLEKLNNLPIENSIDIQNIKKEIEGLKITIKICIKELATTEQMEEIKRKLSDIKI